MSRSVVFDVETSGIDPQLHEIVQFAAIAIDGRKEVDCIEMKVMFNRSKASPEALTVNGFDEEVWMDVATTQLDMCNRVTAFLQKHASIKRVAKSGRPYYVARLIGHNVGFDTGFLGAAFKKEGLFLPADTYRALCTLQRSLWHCLEHELTPKDFKLGTLCDFFKLKLTGDKFHDALFDVRATAALAAHLGTRPVVQGSLLA